MLITVLTKLKIYIKEDSIFKEILLFENQST